MSGRDMRGLRWFILLIIGTVCVGGTICGGYIKFAFDSHQNFVEDRQEMVRRDQAKLEHEEIQASEEGPERKARLEAWKQKYPKIHASYRWHQAELEFKKVQAKGPEWRAKLEAWKVKYPDPDLRWKFRYELAQFDYDEVQAIKEGPERKVKLEAWKVKYPDLREMYGE
jgi:hypothetical protein